MKYYLCLYKGIINVMCHFQGQHFSGIEPRILLLGNPLVWWSNCAILIIYPLLYLFERIREVRGYREQTPEYGTCSTPTFAYRWHSKLNFLKKNWNFFKIYIKTFCELFWLFSQNIVLYKPCMYMLIFFGFAL